MFRSLAGALAFATVLPVPASRTAGVGRGVMTALPLAGAAVGGVAAAVLAGRFSGVRRGEPAGRRAGRVTALLRHPRAAHRRTSPTPPTRLGCYGPPERALSVMRDGSAGPFGVAAVVATILVQSLAFAPGGLAGDARRGHRGPGGGGGRVPSIACRRRRAARWARGSRAPSPPGWWASGCSPSPSLAVPVCAQRWQGPSRWCSSPGGLGRRPGRALRAPVRRDHR